MGLADVALWVNIIVTCSVLVVVFYGVRNTLRANKNNESVMKSGQEVEAIVISARPHDNQTADGRLFLSLLVEFTVGVKRSLPIKMLMFRCFILKNISQVK